MSLRAMSLPWPTDWDGIFGRSAPLVLEIGFGHADFLMYFASQHPGLNVIGIERAHNPMTWAEKKLKKNPLPNVRLVFGDALMSLYCLFAPETLHQVHINFSDPWPKRRHTRRRLIDTSMLEVLVSRLQPDGEFYIATDITDYAEQIQQALAQLSGIENRYAPLPWHDQREHTAIITHYEQKAITAERPRYYFHWRRTGSPISPPPNPGVEFEMANASVYLPLSLEEIMQQFAAEDVYQYGERVVKFHNLYRQVGYPKLAVDTYIDEPLFRQRLLLSIRERSPHDYLVSLEPVGFPRVTRGVQDAVYTLAQLLAALHPEGKLLDVKVKIPKK